MFQAQPDNTVAEELPETPSTSQAVLGLKKMARKNFLARNLKFSIFSGANLECMKEFLESNDFGQYLELFESEEITFDVLAEMTHPELKELGIKAYGHRHRLLRAARRQLSGPQQSMIQG